MQTVSNRADGQGVLQPPEGLAGLRAPLMLQEFVNHSGVLFKVYVIGEHATCVRRRSLPDVPAERLLDLDADVLNLEIFLALVRRPKNRLWSTEVGTNGLEK